MEIRNSSQSVVNAVVPMRTRWTNPEFGPAVMGGFQHPINSASKSHPTIATRHRVSLGLQRKRMKVKTSSLKCWMRSCKIPAERKKQSGCFRRHRRAGTGFGRQSDWTGTKSNFCGGYLMKWFHVFRRKWREYPSPTLTWCDFETRSPLAQETPWNCMWNSFLRGFPMEQLGLSLRIAQLANTK